MSSAAFREGTPIRRVAVVAICLMLALLVAYAAILGSPRWQNGIFARSPLLDAASLADAAMERYRRSGKVDGDTLALSHSALVRAPLLATPFVLKGVDMLDKGDIAEALRLADEAVRRNPRSRPGRTLRMLACLQANRPACAIADIDRLLALAPGQWPIMFDLLRRLALDPASRPALEAHLRHGPVWRGSFIQQLSVSGVDPAIVFALTNAAATGAQASTARNSNTDQTALLASLLKQQDYDRAYLAWIGFLPESALRDVAFIYDGRFRDRPGPLPFNWALADNDKGLAEFLPGGGLSVDFFANQGSTSLVRQMAILPPASYRLSVNAAGKTDPEIATLTWTIQCHGAARPFASLPMNGLGDNPETRTLDFTVPPGCGAQILDLRGKAAVKAGETHIVLHGLTIAAVK